MTILYVIGNGFDLHHRMATRYRNFGEFLRCNYAELREVVDDYFPDDEGDFWSRFEENLASLDADTLESEFEGLVVPYGAEDWSDAFHHDYAYELDRVVRALSEDLLDAFGEWIRSIEIPARASVSELLLEIDPAAKFFSFNYTNTLQQIYGVPDSQIWHIHGSAAGPSPLVLGHGWHRKPEERRSARLDPEFDDTRVVEGAQIIDRYFERTFKPTARIIADERVRFDEISDVDFIRVLGHSLSDVDLPYMAQIVASAKPCAQWRISCFGSPTSLEIQFSKFGARGRATFWPIQEV
jgi:hypothetical protein